MLPLFTFLVLGMAVSSCRKIEADGDGSVAIQNVGKLCGHVFTDTNPDNQLLSNSDILLSGIQVSLSGTDSSGNSVAQQALTDSDGYYCFDSLQAADSSGYKITVPNVPANHLANTYDNDGNLDGMYTVPFQTVSTNITNVDFGYPMPEPEPEPRVLGKLCGHVFTDDNPVGNGPLNTSEDTLLSGIQVTLSGTNVLGANAAATTTTDANGYYCFENLDQADPNGYVVNVPTDPAGHLTNSYDLNGDLDDTYTVPFQVVSTNITNVDFGYPMPEPEPEPRVLGKLCGHVFTDDNPVGNGPLNTSEDTLLSGIQVTLSGTNVLGANAAATTTTDANGYYCFENLDQADTNGYVVNVPTDPAGHLTNSYDLNGDLDDTYTVPFQTVSTNITNVDFGYPMPRELGKLCGHVFTDDNPVGNGPLNTSEDTLLSGIQVTLAGTDVLGNNVSILTSTDDQGYYCFENLDQADPNGYVVNVPTDPAGHLTNSYDLNGDLDDTYTVPFQVVSTNITNVDFGYPMPRELGKLCGHVFTDVNPVGNGPLTSSDVLLSGIQVTLAGTDVLGNTVAQTATTDSSGYYCFENLDQADPNGYVVNVPTDPAGHLTNSYDLNGDLDDTYTVPFQVVSTNITNVDFGYPMPRELGKLCGHVFTDVNPVGNGPLTSSDVLLSGIQVTLAGTDVLGNTVAQTATTDSSGYYCFENLDQANSSGYLVNVPTDPAGHLTNSYDLNGDLDDTYTVPFQTVSTNITNVDFGYPMPTNPLETTIAGVCGDDDSNKITITSCQDGSTIKIYTGTSASGTPVYDEGCSAGDTFDLGNLLPNNPNDYVITQTYNGVTTSTTANLPPVITTSTAVVSFANSVNASPLPNSSQSIEISCDDNAGDVSLLVDGAAHSQAGSLACSGSKFTFTGVSVGDLNVPVQLVASQANNACVAASENVTLPITPSAGDGPSLNLTIDPDCTEDKSEIVLTGCNEVITKDLILKVKNENGSEIVQLIIEDFQDIACDNNKLTIPLSHPKLDNYEYNVKYQFCPKMFGLLFDGSNGTENFCSNTVDNPLDPAPTFPNLDNLVSCTQEELNGVVNIGCNGLPSGTNLDITNGSTSLYTGACSSAVEYNQLLVDDLDNIAVEFTATHNGSCEIKETKNCSIALDRIPLATSIAGSCGDNSSNIITINSCQPGSRVKIYAGSSASGTPVYDEDCSAEDTHLLGNLLPNNPNDYVITQTFNGVTTSTTANLPPVITTSTAVVAFANSVNASPLPNSSQSIEISCDDNAGDVSLLVDGAAHSQAGSLACSGSKFTFTGVSVGDLNVPVQLVASQANNACVAASENVTLPITPSAGDGPSLNLTIDPDCTEDKSEIVLTGCNEVITKDLILKVKNENGSEIVQLIIEDFQDIACDNNKLTIPLSHPKLDNYEYNVKYQFCPKMFGLLFDGSNGTENFCSNTVDNPLDPVPTFPSQATLNSLVSCSHAEGDANASVQVNCGGIPAGTNLEVNNGANNLHTGSCESTVNTSFEITGDMGINTEFTATHNGNCEVKETVSCNIGFNPAPLTFKVDGTCNGVQTATVSSCHPGATIKIYKNSVSAGNFLRDVECTTAGNPAISLNSASLNSVDTHIYAATQQMPNGGVIYNSTPATITHEISTSSTADVVFTGWTNSNSQSITPNNLPEVNDQVNATFTCTTGAGDVSIHALSTGQSIAAKPCTNGSVTFSGITATAAEEITIEATQAGNACIAAHNASADDQDEGSLKFIPKPSSFTSVGTCGSNPEVTVSSCYNGAVIKVYNNSVSAANIVGSGSCSNGSAVISFNSTVLSPTNFDLIVRQTVAGDDYVSVPLQGGDSLNISTSSTADVVFAGWTNSNSQSITSNNLPEVNDPVSATFTCTTGAGNVSLSPAISGQSAKPCTNGSVVFTNLTRNSAGTLSIQATQAGNACIAAHNINTDQQDQSSLLFVIPPPQVACIKGTVWNDTSRDGDTNNENLSTFGLGNIEVRLLGPSGLQIDSVLTNSLGFYDFKCVHNIGVNYSVVVNRCDIPASMQNEITTNASSSGSVSSCPANDTIVIPSLAASGSEENNFGYVGLPSAVGLMEVCANSSNGQDLNYSWSTGWEENSLGFYVQWSVDNGQTWCYDTTFQTCGTSGTNQAMTLAEGAGDYSVNFTIPSNMNGEVIFRLQEYQNDLSTIEYDEQSMRKIVAGDPVNLCSTNVSLGNDSGAPIGNSDTACNGGPCYCKSFNDVTDIDYSDNGVNVDEFILKDSTAPQVIYSISVNAISINSLGVSSGVTQLHNLVNSNQAVNSVTLCCKEPINSWSSIPVSNGYGGMSGSLQIRTPNISGRSAFGLQQMLQCDVFEVNGSEFNSVGVN